MTYCKFTVVGQALSFLMNFLFIFFIVRDKLKDLSKEYDKSENDLKALQSVGQVFVWDKYHVAQSFCGSLFLQIGDFCVLRELIFVIRTDWFFFLGINFGDFQKVPDKSLIVF